MDEALAVELEGFPWFANVGQPLTAEQPFPFVQVASWDEAYACWDQTWEDIRAHTGEQLIAFLRRTQPRDLDRWNDHVQAAMVRVLTPLAERVWQPLGQQIPFGELFKDVVGRDIRGAILEHEYRRFANRPVFFLRLLPFYRSGHFPCGWCGSWPEGELIVY